VLGDMLELGEQSRQFHAGLAEAVLSEGVDTLFLAGPEMAALAAALPPGFPVEYRASTDELAGLLTREIGPGDAIMIKSSNRLGFSRLVDALINHFPAQAARTKRA
jgi:UDP-N-acetylmuramoyl-tripeptide--D-alanyl-D-alanine ligase